MPTQTNTATLQAINDYLETPQSRAGFIGRFTYDYDGRYLLEVMGRYDGSWKFPPTKRWGFFPSVSAGWRTFFRHKNAPLPFRFLSSQYKHY